MRRVNLAGGVTCSFEAGDEGEDSEGAAEMSQMDRQLKCRLGVTVPLRDI